MPQSISAKMRAKPCGLKGFAAFAHRAIGLKQTLPLTGITIGIPIMTKAHGLNTIYCATMATRYRITENDLQNNKNRDKMLILDNDVTLSAFA